MVGKIIQRVPIWPKDRKRTTFLLKFHDMKRSVRICFLKSTNEKALKNLSSFGRQSLSTLNFF